MHRWWHVSAVLMAGMMSFARAQVLERQAIVPAGLSATIPGARISTSGGQTASSRLGRDATGLTQGFQQPLFQIGTLAATDFAGSAGDSRQSDITLTLAGGELSLASAIRLKLRFNATLLEPAGTTLGATTLSDSIADGRRTVELLLPVQSFAPSPIVLTTIGFRIGLGNDSLSKLEIVDAVPVGGPVMIRSTPGRFTLSGICREGGPRLVNPAKRATIVFKPNPVSSSAELEFDLHETAQTRLALVDMFGREITTIVDGRFDAGHYRVDYDMSSIPSGNYVLVLNASSQRTARNLVVQH